jgi:DNA-binding response OmpR family regulator
VQILNTDYGRKNFHVLFSDYLYSDTDEQRSVLIVEDDLALRPLWERTFVAKNVKIDWATNLEEAEQHIRTHYSQNQPYNLVIADISLEGRGTGIDLWNRYGEEASNFVFVTGLPISKHDFHTMLSHGYPPYFKKPLTAKKCLEIAELAKG